MLCHDREMLCRDRISIEPVEAMSQQKAICRDRISIEPAEAMSQQEALCRNKDQVELKPKDKTLSRHVTTLS